MGDLDEIDLFVPDDPRRLTNEIGINIPEYGESLLERLDIMIDVDSCDIIVALVVKVIRFEYNDAVICGLTLDEVAKPVLAPALWF